MMKIIIYFLLPPTKGSHSKSDNTHTIINIHPLDHMLDTCYLISSSCSFFKIPKPHHTTLQVITTRASKGCQMNTGPSKNGGLKLIKLHMHQGSPLFTIFRSLWQSLHNHSSVGQGNIHNHPSSLTSLQERKIAV